MEGSSSKAVKNDADALSHRINKYQTNINVIEITPLAYAKIFLHALRHPTSDIGGFLIGCKSAITLKIKDVIPTNHSLPVGPILEAVAETFSYTCDSSNGIIGFYFGNESSSLHNKDKYPPYISGIFDSILANTGDCTILQINDSQIGSTNHLFLETQGRYSISVTCGTAKLQQIISNMLEEELQYKIKDYEDYLNSSADNPEDYYNVFLSSIIPQDPNYV